MIELRKFSIQLLVRTTNVFLYDNHLVKHTGALVYRLLITSLFRVVRDPHSYTHNMFH